ncbi:4a-hydroxytetrahydrobiopterin dehydratase [Notoacmeibacter sp. MSK16QG-6]|uniref:4a-hydroxytetrahydrobiopterin dehydratase n=1 Tax=Notoacmeibacter sp. MSK16QG-6 TaxID=2957982 RepID=UPI00209F1C5A|nr:4a-hydroxytetrahydrobiopterin dehydratase [Notoacmeibacter sp. MSK16QG-6]MCP1199160.1 4a-hydroxytetrahydrobiopterin dehydratase [Notoacmeibacter sp. MSK16QG-6]
MAQIMQEDDLDKALQQWLPGWEVAQSGKAIGKTFKFEDFPAAMAFMNAVGDEAEKMNHHPDWSNSYNRVDVELSTHDAGGVTERDIELARIMEEKAPSGQ